MVTGNKDDVAIDSNPTAVHCSANLAFLILAKGSCWLLYSEMSVLAWLISCFCADQKGFNTDL